MERYKSDFPIRLKGIDFETLEKSEHSIYGLSKDLNIIYVNPSWIRIAEENGLESALEKYPLGSSIANILKGQKIKDFYIQHYNQVLETGKVWHHEYECSSLDIFKQFHQGVYPLKDGMGLIVINALRVSLPMDQINRKAMAAFQEHYVQSTGYINQCSNCRYSQRADNEEIWDWIPEWVENMPANLSHTICPTCFDYYWKYSRIKFSPINLEGEK